MPNSIDVIIPIYNALDDVRHCVASLLANHGGYSLNLIIVNDRSDSETTTWLREADQRESNITLIEHEHNTGYSGAVNSGFNVSNAQYVVLLNSDTIVSKNWLQGLIRCAESNPKIGIVSPVSNSAVHQSVPSIPGSLSSTINFPSQHEVDAFANRLKHCSYSIYSTPPLVHGFCQFIKREVIDSIGVIDDERFPSGMGSELDYCFRAEDKGYISAVADDTFVFHSKAKSLGEKARLSSEWKIKLIEKYDEKRFKAAAQETASNTVLTALRATFSFELFRKTQQGQIADFHYNIAYIHHVDEDIELIGHWLPLALAMYKAGIYFQIAVPSSLLDTVFHLYKHDKLIKKIIIGYQDQDDINQHCIFFDFIMCSHQETLEWLEQIHTDNPDILFSFWLNDMNYLGKSVEDLDTIPLSTFKSIFLLSDSNDVAKTAIRCSGLPVYNLPSLFKKSNELSISENILSFFNTNNLYQASKQSETLLLLIQHALHYYRKDLPVAAFNKGIPPRDTLLTLDDQFENLPTSLRKRRLQKFLKYPHAYFADSSNSLLRPLRFLFRQH